MEKDCVKLYKYNRNTKSENIKWRHRKLAQNKKAETKIVEKGEKKEVKSKISNWINAVKKAPVQVPVKEQKLPDKLKSQEHKLNSTWILYTLDTKERDWKPEHFKKICKVRTIEDFWSIFNNFNKLGIKYRRLFMYREPIIPVWEDSRNSNGGECSFKIEVIEAIELITYIGIQIIGETFLEDNTKINGFSINPKNGWSIIKIWHSEMEEEFIKLLPETITTKYMDIIKYKKHTMI